MRLLKKSMAMALVAAMVVTLAPADSADAAKKVKLDKSKKTVEVGKTVKVKVKNAKKSAKVTWKSSKKKVAKIKKSTKKGNATATVLGVKKGKSVIKATVKTGKKKVTLKCTVTVKEASAETPTVAPTATATVAPGTATPAATATAVPGTATPKPTPKATRTPKPSPTPSPTPMPEKPYEFAAVTNGIPIDVSSYVSIAGNGGYNEKTGRVEINDQAATDVSQGSWPLPASIPAIQLGDLVTFRVQGFNYGTSGFRFWIGTGTSGACTPVLLNNTIDETLKMDKFPCVVTDEEGNSKTMNQMQLVPDPETSAFDITFTFKAGESQNDTDGVFSDFTLKYIMGGDTSGYIDGLCIKNIYYITDDASLLPTPTPDPDATPTPAPDFVATKVAEPFTVDGVAEEAWDAIEAINFTSRIACDNAGASTTSATAKLAWDANNLYGLVTVLDENIDATSGDDYRKDGIEFFLDEDNDAVATWDANTDAFQYRFTGLAKDDAGEKLAATVDTFAGGTQAAKDAYAGIETEYTFIEGGYIVEFKIPFAAEKVAGARVGFDALVQDCKDGGRDAEIYLGQTDRAMTYYNLTDTFKTLELVEPYVEPEVEPGTIEDLGAVEYTVNGTAEKTVNEDGSVSFANADGFAGVYIPLGKTIAAGEKVNVKVEYAAEGQSRNARLLLVKGGEPGTSVAVGPMNDVVEGELLADAESDAVQVKVGAWGQTFTKLTIKKVVITYPEATEGGEATE